MKPFISLSFLSFLILALAFYQRVAFSQYDYIIGQKITIEDVEPSDNYEMQVFLEEEEALASVFKGCDEVLVDQLALTPEEKQKLENRLKARIDENAFDVFTGKKDGKIYRYAIITDEMGCFHPITFIMSMKPDGNIEQVAVMIYRESRGKEVIRQRFLHQYKGKSLNNPIRINKDIINITGATTSVRGVNRGVRKMMAVLDEFYLHRNRETTPVPYSRTGNQAEEEETQQIFSQAYPSMGDIIEILITGTTEKNASNAFKEAFKEVDRINKTLNEELKKVNHKAWKKPVKCDKELFNIIKSSIYYSEITNGGFDITEGTLTVELSKDTKRLSEPEDLSHIFTAAAYKNIIIDTNEDADGTIFLKDKYTKLDLSLVVNGYVVDNVIKVLENHGISHALVNFGGAIRVIGNPPGNTAWRIAIPDPKDNGKSIGFVHISNRAVAVSGDYEKMLINTRKEYSHITGSNLQRPFDADLLGAVVIASTAFEADALAAAAHLSGLNKDMGLINNIPDAGGIDLYERSDGSIEVETSKGIKTYFVQKTESISPQRVRQSCSF
jgi:thiamine biosynthesis lipoprotein ApbE/Na+-translocating ferredoxin:NAD+ oxidoreductase RnfG subunit